MEVPWIRIITGVGIGKTLDVTEDPDLESINLKEDRVELTYKQLRPAGPGKVVYFYSGIIGIEHGLYEDK
ncbi:hypothetical protein HYG87_02785 [Methanobacterium alkalithermotolerans]|uniref:Uncharacterized protein n=1 Tax=Methanobacterium alkalithermotolerans TaxID=2731220 RepID=A0A8T8K5K3_9EURY|nr:hypothetical protein [Methanobacterium alkalithermotolerans]QUH22775.1 hypothetical protein HYG87_02785 [Methanobacterium alkalithermotolerans]RJS49327.1 MAG: hypothetical protein CIT03_03560 [Methanobacterium sp.]